MTDDLDRDLMRAFAVAAAPLPEEEFLHRLASRMAWRRRTRAVLWLGAALLLLLVGSLGTRTLVEVSLVAAERFGELLISPLGWTLSLLLAVVVVRRGRLFRR